MHSHMYTNMYKYVCIRCSEFAGKTQSAKTLLSLIQDDACQHFVSLGKGAGIVHVQVSLMCAMTCKPEQLHLGGVPNCPHKRGPC